MQYDYRLNAYIVDEKELRDYSFNYLNNFKNKVILDVSSTKCLNMNMFSKLNNPNLMIRVRGGYDKERAEYWSRKNGLQPEVRKGRKGIRGLSYYEDANIYSVSELVKIDDEIKKIEAGIMPEWSQIKKALYVYDRLREEVIYHPKYETQQSYEIRTLRGLISKKTVCAGYALIFKEIMDRLGIECDYVEGCTTKVDSKKDVTNHAWNLIKINGRHYPIDLTWDACRYRQGETDSFGYFSNLQKFRETHFPCSIEKVKDYSILFGLRSDFVKKTIRQFKRKKEFSTSIIRITGDNKEDIRLVQTGRVDKTSEKPMYRYVMAIRDKNGTFRDYRIIHSQANFLSIYNGFLKGKYTDNSPALKGHLALFSYENVNKALKRGTTYIGNVVPSKSDSKGFEFKYDYDIANEFPNNYREEVRQSGEHILINESMRRVVLGKTLYFGSIASFSDSKLKHFRQYKVVSDKSLLNDKSYNYINEFLDEDRLDRKVREAGGYIGYYNNGVRTYDPKMNEYFNIRSVGDITINDIVPFTSVSNDGRISKINFDDLKKAYHIYDVQYSKASKSCIVIDKKMGKECTNKRIETVAVFADMWRSVAGVKWLDADERGEYYAFCDGAALVFDYLMKNCIDSLERAGMIDFSKLSGYDMEKQGYSNYKHASEIIENIKKYPFFQKVLHDFCDLQVESYYSESVKKRSKNYDVCSANDELFDMFGDENSLKLSEISKNAGKRN